MKREEHLEFCKICKNKSFDLKKGITCGLTSDIANFKEFCPNFIQIEGINYLENKKKNEKEKKLKEKKRKIEIKREKRKVKEKINLDDIYLLASGSLIAVFLNKLLIYADITEKNGINQAVYFLPFLLASIFTLLFRKRDKKYFYFFGDIKFRLLPAIIISLLTILYTIIIKNQYSAILSGFIGLTIIIFLLSFVSYLFVKPIFLITKERFLLKKHLFKPLIITGISLLVLLGMLEKNFLIKREKFYWQSDNSLSWDNFRAYPNYLSKYDAGIMSFFEYSYIGDSVDSILIETISQPHHSWVKKDTKESKYVLRHENYHFNISELIARKFRKEISELSKSEINKKQVKSIFIKYRNQLATVQDKYDRDTEHSILVEKQKDWEYLIDSLLNEYEVYKNTLISFNSTKENKHKYYRQVHINPQYYIYGRFPIDSALAQNVEHYCFYYENNNVSKIEFKNKGKLAKDKYFGVSVIKIESSSNNDRWSFFNSNLNRTLNDEKVHEINIKRELSKNLITKTYYDKSKKLTLDQSGISKIVWELDYKKRKEVGRFYDLNNKQITDNEGFHIIKLRYDKNDNIIEKTNLDNKNQLKETKDGVAFLQYSYDFKNNTSQVKSFNSNKEPTPYSGFIAEANYNYDLEGNVICESYKKADGTPYFDENRIVISYYKYDKFSNLLEESYYGNNKNLIIDDEGIGRIERKYNSIGNVIEAINYDAYDNYLNDNNNYCMSSYSYDSLNIMTSQVQYYADSLNVLHHFKTIQYKFDDNSNLISESYFDEEGSLLPDSTGSSIIKYEYDQNANLTKVEYYDENENLKPVLKDIAIFKYEYDDKNNKLIAAYYDINDKLTNAVDDIAYDRYFYNNKNQLIERRYYDDKNNLTKNSDSVEVVKWKRDMDGNIIEEKYFDNKGRLIEDKNGILLFKLFYDNNKNKIRIEYYNKELKLVKKGNNKIAIVKQKFNSENNLIETAYYDRENKLLDIPGGYALDKQLFDKFGRLVRREYYSKYRQLTVTSYGYAAFDWEYDRNDNVIAEIYRDENNELIEDDDGYAFYNWIFNRNGEAINTYGFKADDNVLASINYGDFNTSINSIYRYPQYANYSVNDSRIQSTYFDNGQKESEVSYRNGKPDGIYRSWYKTGEPECEILYVNGKREGVMYEYYKNGQTKRVMKYENNILINNSQITYYENGKVHTMYLDNELQEWDEKGNKIIEEG